MLALKDSLHLSQYKKKEKKIPRLDNIYKTLWDTLALNDRLTMRAARKYHHLYSRIYHNVSSAVVSAAGTYKSIADASFVYECMCVRAEYIVHADKFAHYTPWGLKIRDFSVAALWNLSVYRWIQRNNNSSTNARHAAGDCMYEYVYLCALLIFARSPHTVMMTIWWRRRADETTQYRWSRGQ